MSRKVTNELNHFYGDFQIISEYPERDKANGCVKWTCKCTTCGALKVWRGASLRASEVKAICYKHARTRKR